MEAKLGRRLTWQEIVHHKNHDKRDNRESNLEVMTRKEHARHHLLKHPLERTCDICGNTFAPLHRGRDRTCSAGCRNVAILLTRLGRKAKRIDPWSVLIEVRNGLPERSIARRHRISRSTVRRIGKWPEAVARQIAARRNG